jgi:hypothetical protein
MDQQPSIGRIVHYRSFGTPNGEFVPECRAAIISEVDLPNLGRIGLVALNPTGMFFHSLADGGVEYAESATTGGSWHWPERV